MNPNMSSSEPKSSSSTAATHIHASNPKELLFSAVWPLYNIFPGNSPLPIQRTATMAELWAGRQVHHRALWNAEDASDRENHGDRILDFTTHIRVLPGRSGEQTNTGNAKYRAMFKRKQLGVRGSPSSLSQVLLDQKIERSGDEGAEASLLRFTLNPTESKYEAWEWETRVQVPVWWEMVRWGKVHDPKESVKYDMEVVIRAQLRPNTDDPQIAEKYKDAATPVFWRDAVEASLPQGETHPPTAREPAATGTYAAAAHTDHSFAPRTRPLHVVFEQGGSGQFHFTSDLTGQPSVPSHDTAPDAIRFPAPGVSLAGHIPQNAHQSWYTHPTPWNAQQSLLQDSMRQHSPAIGDPHVFGRLSQEATGPAGIIPQGFSVPRWQSPSAESRASPPPTEGEGFAAAVRPGGSNSGTGELFDFGDMSGGSPAGSGDTGAAQEGGDGSHGSEQGSEEFLQDPGV